MAWVVVEYEGDAMTGDEAEIKFVHGPFPAKSVAEWWIGHESDRRPSRGYFAVRAMIEPYWPDPDDPEVAGNVR